MTLSASTHRPLTSGLTGAQQRIVEWDEGPLVVIAGAGTGKTRVIVERVAHLLRTKGAPDGTPEGTATARNEVLPAEPAPDHDPFAGPLVPEQILVLTYNVRAAKELTQRIEREIGAAARSRLAVSNFHSFCHRIQTARAPRGPRWRSRLCARPGRGRPLSGRQSLDSTTCYW